MNEDVKKGPANYHNVLFSVYNFYVFQLSNTYIWKCPTKHVRNLYSTHVSTNHLDIGVGTNYFLKKRNLQFSTRLVLMNTTMNCLKNESKACTSSFSKNLYPKYPRTNS